MLSIERHNDHLSIDTPATITVGLRVLSRRDDGFHDIESLVMAVDLTDTLEVQLDANGQVSLEVAADPIEAPADESNLVLRAARLLQRESQADNGQITVLEIVDQNNTKTILTF